MLRFIVAGVWGPAMTRLSAGRAISSRTLLCLRFQPPARWSFAHHYSQHAFIRDDKSAKDLLNIADQDQPFPNFSGDSSVLPGIANLFQRGQLFAG